MGISIKKIFAVTVALFTLAATTAPAQAMDMKGWQKAVVQKVITEQRYPRAAMAREIEGRAKVRLTVDATGAITNHEIVELTGEDVLDSEIPKLVERLNPLPSLPDGKSEMSFVLPLSWTLN